MTRGVRWYLVGSLALVTLTGCKPSWFEEREPWRHDAEMACLKSGAVKEGTSVALLGPIEGPGICGADFPLKVTGLGEDTPESAPLSYADEVLRPPGDVPQASPAYSPRPSYRPPTAQSPAQYPADAPFSVNPAYPHDTHLPPQLENRAAPSYPPARYPADAPFSVNPAYPHDTRLPPNQDYGAPPPRQYEAPPPRAAPAYEPPPPYPGAGRYPPPPRAPYSGAPNGPVSLMPPGIDPPHGDAAGEVQQPMPSYGAPRSAPARAYPSPANADDPPYRPPPG